MASFTLGTTSANPGTKLQIKVTGSSTSWLLAQHFNSPEALEPPFRLNR